MNELAREINEKLDAFIVKYYKNQILKGVLLSLTLFFGIFLLISLTEYQFYLQPLIKTILFYAIIASIVLSISYFIIIPALKILKIGKRISQKNAAKIISTHFPEIKDKIINIIELRSMSASDGNDASLVIHAINQKTNDLKPYNFKFAINYSQNKKYLKYLTPVILIILFILIVSPQIFSESSERLINYDIIYKKPAPFDFILENKNLTIKKGESIKISLKIKGRYIPSEVFFTFNNFDFIMNKEKKDIFSYELKNLTQSQTFKFKAENYSSDEIEIKVLPAPAIIAFQIKAKIPEYTGIKSFDTFNGGDLTVPEGTTLTWNISTSETNTILFKLDKKESELQEKSGHFVHTLKIQKNLSYKIIPSNDFFTDTSGVFYTITAIPDRFPDISYNQMSDSANMFLHYFSGRINDDYGFEKLTFNYRIMNKNEEKSSEKFKQNYLNIDKTRAKQEYNHIFNFAELTQDENMKIEYYFEIFDNDKVNGSKSVKTEINTFNPPSFEQITQAENEAEKNIEKKINQSSNLAREIKEDIQKLNQKSIEGNISEWEKNQMMQSILDKNEQLEKLIKNTAQDNKNKNELKKNNSEMSKELLEKQKQIEEILNNTMDEELKKLLEQIKELQEQYNKQNENQLNETIELKYEELEKQLDRNLEMLKRHKVENNIEKTIDKLNKLSEKQDQLSENKLDKATESEKQKEIQKEFEETEKIWKETLKEDNELKKELIKDEFEQEFNELNEELKNTEQNINNSNAKKTNESQKKSAKQMKQLADKMQNMMNSGQSQSQSEDLESLKKTAKNLLTFSFLQEDILKNMEKQAPTTKEFQKNYKRQINLKNDFKIIEDSLSTLAERIPQINLMIKNEVNSIKTQLQNVNTSLNDSKKRDALIGQQFVMTSANNLSLLLNEMISQMQNSQSGGGEGQSDNKRSKKPSYGEMMQQQQGLKQQLENMLKQMKEAGNQPDKNAQNKQLAKMLAQQEIFRQMLNQMQNGENTSPDAAKILNEIKQMNEQNKNDLINKNITPQLLNRQQKILTRLLEAENAQNERETENKRESNEADERKYDYKEDYFNKMKNKPGGSDNLNKSNLRMNNFYKNLYENYQLKISN